MMMMRISKINKFIIVVLCSAFIINITYAVFEVDNISIFKKYYNVIPFEDINTPAVYKVQFKNDISSSFVLYDKTDNKFIYKEIYSDIQNKDYKIINKSTGEVVEALSDFNSKTKISLIPKSYNSKSAFLIKLNKRTLINRIDFNFKNYGVFPPIVRVYDIDNSVVLANKRFLTKNYIEFPEIITSNILVELFYSQPMDIYDIEIIGKDIEKSNYYFYFLANPGHKYSVYYDSALYPFRVRESGIPTISFKDAKYIVDAHLEGSFNNDEFIEPDQDGDLIPDKLDNCPTVKNASQIDKNKNNIGDACEDFDLDGILNYQDNCPNIANEDQKDTDLDGVGDKCDKQDNRFLEDKPYIMYIVISISLLVLLGILSFLIIKQKDQNNI